MSLRDGAVHYKAADLKCGMNIRRSLSSRAFNKVPRLPSPIFSVAEICVHSGGEKKAF